MLPGDRRVTDPSQVDAVVRAARAAPPGPGGVLVVAVDGRSGSGKSSLATAIARHLGAQVVRMDALYPGWDGLAAGVELLLTSVLEPLWRGEQAAVPTWSWVRGRPGPVRPLPACGMVVVEGVGALHGRAGELAQVRVWLEAPDAIRKDRALARDGATYAPHWERWAAQEAALLARFDARGAADLVLETGG
ncbi:MAG: hypothetical protein ACRCYX_05970 [Dermatophilaceae bacterium]